MPDDLTDDDKAILAALLRETIAASRFPLSPRVQTRLPVWISSKQRNFYRAEAWHNIWKFAT